MSLGLYDSLYCLLSYPKILVCFSIFLGHKYVSTFSGPQGFQPLVPRASQGCTPLVVVNRGAGDGKGVGQGNR